MKKQTTYRLTRYQKDDQKLAYHCPAPSVWRIVHVDGRREPAEVGLIYCSKAELLADLDRFAKEFGF